MPTYHYRNPLVRGSTKDFSALLKLFPIAESTLFPPLPLPGDSTLNGADSVVLPLGMPRFLKTLVLPLHLLTANKTETIWSLSNPTTGG